VKAHEMPKTLIPTDLRSVAFAMPAHAAEPAATPTNGAQWCTAWRAGLQTEMLNTSFPSGGEYGITFSVMTGNEITRKSLFERCVSPTTKKLAVERRAAREGAGGAPSNARCRSDLASGASAYANLGRCIADGGRLIQS
jgi:hypothetical protein